MHHILSKQYLFVAALTLASLINTAFATTKPDWLTQNITPTWQEIPTESQHFDKIYLDTHSMQRDGNKASYWTKTILKNDAHDSHNGRVPSKIHKKTVAYVVDLNETLCDTHQTRLAGFMPYGTNNKPLGDFEYITDKTWQETTPKSLSGALSKLVCDYTEADTHDGP